MRVLPFLCASLLTLAAGAAGTLARAQDDQRLKLMHEPFSYTDVIDAADDRDLFDLNAHLDYSRTRETGEIDRERTTVTGQRMREKVADSERVLSTLTPGVDVGLYRDLMAFVRMPLILSDARKLTLPHGVTSADAQQRLSDATGSNGEVNALFQVPFTSPTRAGLDYIALGGAWSPFNQMRKESQPTWVLRLEGRRAVGRVLRACPQDEKTAGCGSTSSEDRNGDGVPDGTHGGTRAGTSRGVSAVVGETRFSRRYRRFEPYGGLSFQIEWASSARQAFRSAGYGHARPGPQTGATLGVAIIPWEDRGAYQRIVFDVRTNVTHVARGTDYSPLFDALGTSSDPSLDRSRDGVQFYGLTEVESHLRYGGQIGVEIQAARYVRFALGSQLQWTTQHALTGRDPCDGPSAGVPDDGRVCSSGRADKRERGVIDAPGRRFLIRDQMLIGVYAQATASF